MNRRVVVACSFLALVALVAPSATAAPITVFSTGLGTPGTVDLNYELIQAPTGVALEAIIIDPSKLAGVWAVPETAANWIGVTDDDARTGAPMAPSDPGHLDAGAGLYVFRTTFDLTGHVTTSTVIQGRWAADNVAEIFVNGISTGITRVGSGNVGYGLLDFLLDSTNTNFVAGLNTLDFHVINMMSFHDIGNPVGLLVQGMTIDSVVTPEPGTWVLLGTGLLIAARRVHRVRRSRQV